MVAGLVARLLGGVTRLSSEAFQKRPRPAEAVAVAIRDDEADEPPVLVVEDAAE